jgi:thioredoxin 2
MAAPLLEEIGREHPGQLLVLKVNTDENPELASAYQVTGLPTFVLFSNQRELGRQGGLPPAAAFRSWVQGLLRTSARSGS